MQQLHSADQAMLRWILEHLNASDASDGTPF